MNYRFSINAVKIDLLNGGDNCNDLIYNVLFVKC